MPVDDGVAVRGEDAVGVDERDILPCLTPQSGDDVVDEPCLKEVSDTLDIRGFFLLVLGLAPVDIKWALERVYSEEGGDIT